jgi:predicted phosphohydrolase
MIVQYCSDLHLEFPENKAFLQKNPIPVKGDVLILAGDIVPFKLQDEHDDFWNYLSINFQFVYWIPGNHEYYYSDISECSGTIYKKLRDNVFLVNNSTAVHDDVRFIFSTLWTEISSVNQFFIQSRMSDFKVIRDGNGVFTPKGYNQLHKESLQFLTEELAKNDVENTVVVTHHVPTLLKYPEKYKGDILNEAFAVELKYLIKNREIDYWIFGHHHQNKCDFSIGKTKLVSSQLGYVRYNEHLDFCNNSSFVI